MKQKLYITYQLAGKSQIKDVTVDVVPPQLEEFKWAVRAHEPGVALASIRIIAATLIQSDEP